MPTDAALGLKLPHCSNSDLNVRTAASKMCQSVSEIMQSAITVVQDLKVLWICHWFMKRH